MSLWTANLFLQGKQTPVLFGTALGNFGVDHVLDAFMNWAPEPKAHPNTRACCRC